MFNLYFLPRTLRASTVIPYLIKRTIQSSQFLHVSVTLAEKTERKYVSVNRSKTPAAINEKQSGQNEGPTKGRTYATAVKSIKDQLMCKIAPKSSDPPTSGDRKITILGAGRVGMACAICILCQGISNEICIIDMDKDKARSEVMDLQHGAYFLNDAKITGGSDFKLSNYSRMYIITLDAASKSTDKNAVLDKNATILKKIIPQIVLASPRSVILIVTNPVDILTYFAWRLSGFPMGRVLGSGAVLDSSRFRFFISERLDVAPTSCDAIVVGEHGNSSVAVWSGVNVSGVSLRELDETIGLRDDGQGWNLIHEKVVGASKEVIKGKGHTNWAIGLSCASIANAILSNTGAVMPVSISVKGMYGIDEDIFLSLPCVLNSNGVSNVIMLKMSSFEEDKLRASARVIAEAQCGLKL